MKIKGSDGGWRSTGPFDLKLPDGGWRTYHLDGTHGVPLKMKMPDDTWKIVAWSERDSGRVGVFRLTFEQLNVPPLPHYTDLLDDLYSYGSVVNGSGSDSANLLTADEDGSYVAFGGSYPDPTMITAMGVFTPPLPESVVYHPSAVNSGVDIRDVRVTYQYKMSPSGGGLDPTQLNYQNAIWVNSPWYTTPAFVRLKANQTPEWTTYTDAPLSEVQNFSPGYNPYEDPRYFIQTYQLNRSFGIHAGNSSYFQLSQLYFDFVIGY